MTTYAIGDLHGCLEPLQRLLDRIRFDPAADTLWFVGDLVNRGPQSLATLRYVRSLGDAAISVLGNHDLHLLALLHGVRNPGSKDTLDAVLSASDRIELSDWLRSLPLLHVDKSLGFALVHAGIHPLWSLKKAKKLAAEVQGVLRSDRFDDCIQQMYGNGPENWSKDLSESRRRRFAINVFTRMRYCNRAGGLDFSFNGAPRKAPATLVPWYAVPRRKPLSTTIVFGHWSSHPAMGPSSILPLDRGCVWGGSLTACALETGEMVSVPCAAN